MNKLVAAALVAVSTLALSAGVAPASAASMMSMPVMVGGAPMYSTKNIIENAVNSKDHTTLVAAVKAAGLVEALSGPGPFTVFAPTNEAFAALPAGTVDELLKPANKKKLVKILTAHVAAGHWDVADLLAKAKASGGTFSFKTLSGDTLRAMTKGDRVYIVDENGGVARITIKNVEQSNGVIQVVDKVLLPK
jgi:uncharacterized surface protein with fasciclin (FAS1) repeats